MIGIHPFVVGTPDGAAAMRRVLARLKKDDMVWLTDTDAILKAAVPKSSAFARGGSKLRWTSLHFGTPLRCSATLR